MIGKLISTFRFRSQFKQKNKQQQQQCDESAAAPKERAVVLHHDHAHACVLCFSFFVSLQMHPNSETSTTLKRNVLVEKLKINRSSFEQKPFNSMADFDLFFR